MSETWWDDDGIQWEYRGGFNWIIGHDPSKKKKRTPKEEAEIDAILKQYDEDVANTPINVTAPRNILADFVDELALHLSARDMFERATGKEVRYGDRNLQFPKDS